ncbi:MAG: hypothetical protein OEQ13_03710 [Acidobacteriota bacterium]|nr:hypothetical protein [Acidobacteriota bacterium]
MRNSKFRPLVAMLALLVGCVPCLQPIYTDRDLIFEPELLGTWSEEDEDETWTFSAHDPRSYRLVIKNDEGAEGVFDAHLAEIGGKRFLDLFPTELDPDMNSFYAFHLLPAHTFYLVQQVEPRLRISYMEPEWLSDYVDENPTAIRHEKIDDRVVLTASTDELQEFALGHIETPGAYSEPSEMLRVRD